MRAYASRIERYDAVKQSIFARVKRLAVDETAIVAAMAKKAYSVSYYSVIADKRQYAEYKHVLGEENVPKTFASFRSIKENHPDRFNELRTLYREKNVDKSAKSDIMESKIGETAVPEVYSVGKIDIAKYQKVTLKRIITDDVILTDNRKDHIIKRRGQDFYDEYSKYFPQVISNPDYIFKDEHENSALACKTFVQSGNSVNLVVRLVVEGDDANYKNSIITAIKESEKRFAQRLRNNKPVYKKIDNNE